MVSSSSVTVCVHHDLKYFQNDFSVHHEEGQELNQ